MIIANKISNNLSYTSQGPVQSTYEVRIVVLKATGWFSCSLETFTVDVDCFYHALKFEQLKSVIIIWILHILQYIGRVLIQLKYRPYIRLGLGLDMQNNMQFKRFRSKDSFFDIPRHWSHRS